MTDDEFDFIQTLTNLHVELSDQPVKEALASGRFFTALCALHEAREGEHVSVGVMDRLVDEAWRRGWRLTTLKLLEMGVSKKKFFDLYWALRQDGWDYGLAQWAKLYRTKYEQK